MDNTGHIDRPLLPRKNKVSKYDVRYITEQLTNYCPLLKIMQLLCREWVHSLNIRDDGRDIHTERVIKSIYHCMAFFPLVAICQVFSFVTRLKFNLCTALITCKTIQYNRIFSHAQNTTAL